MASKKLTDREKLELVAYKLNRAGIAVEFESRANSMIIGGRRLSFDEQGRVVKVQEIVKGKDGKYKYVTVAQGQEHKQATGEGV
ncbi:MAG: hypothetical protein BWY57_03077 [Betaproteobacteria bacterium ADurb.Bin341]|nr:MAG: hypothetical protein BWY57_03077 [Betaproteobacteria bacterium ADurb.Bin341]